MTDEPKTERMQIVLGPTLRAAIRQWWHANAIGSESEAVRLLVQRALEADGIWPPRAG